MDRCKEDFRENPAQVGGALPRRLERSFHLVNRVGLCLALLVMTFTCGCETLPGMASERMDAPTAARALTSTIEAMTRALEEGNTFALTDHVSERYTPSRLTLKSELDEAFETWSEYRVEITRDRTDIQDDHATAVVRWRRTRTRRTDGFRELTTGRVDLQFALENNEWKLALQIGDILFGK